MPLVLVMHQNSNPICYEWYYRVQLRSNFSLSKSYLLDTRLSSPKKHVHAFLFRIRFGVDNINVSNSSQAHIWPKSDQAFDNVRHESCRINAGPGDLDRSKADVLLDSDSYFSDVASDPEAWRTNDSTARSSLFALSPYLFLKIQIIYVFCFLFFFFFFFNRQCCHVHSNNMSIMATIIGCSERLKCRLTLCTPWLRFGFSLLFVFLLLLLLKIILGRTRQRYIIHDSPLMLAPVHENGKGIRHWSKSRLYL